LIIGKPTKAKLTKAQRAFNRLVTTIESLRREIETRTAHLNGALTFYATELHPLEKQIAERQKEVIRLMFPFLSGRQLGRGQLKTLREVIALQLHAVIKVEGDLTEDDLKKIFQVVEGVSVETSKQQEMEAAREAFEEELEDLGVEVELSDFGPDMTPEQLAAKLAEMEQQIRESQGPGGRGDDRPKTKRQREQEIKEQALEAMRTKDLSSLYKQLAKLLHPDLEQDPTRRLEKEAAMKELTIAYRNQDLHGLLKLEIEWITREQTNAAQLTDQKLSVYNQVLQEQVAELKSAIYTLPLHPRYHPIRNLVDAIFRTVLLDRVGEVQNLKRNLREMKETIRILQGPNVLLEIKGLLGARMARRRPGPFDDVPF